jgi:hypothetical protein
VDASSDSAVPLVDSKLDGQQAGLLNATIEPMECTAPATNLVVGPSQALYGNTPVLSKVEVVLIQQGTVSTVQWELRDQDGSVIDLAGIFPIEGMSKFIPDTDFRKPRCDAIWNVLHDLNPSYYAGQDCSLPEEMYSIEVRIQPADEPRDPMWITSARAADPKQGLIRFDVPDRVSDYGGVYVLNLGICRQSDGRPVYIHRGLLGVERSAWRDICRIKCQIT